MAKQVDTTNRVPVTEEMNSRVINPFYTFTHQKSSFLSAH